MKTTKNKDMKKEHKAKGNLDKKSQIKKALELIAKGVFTF